MQLCTRPHCALAPPLPLFSALPRPRVAPVGARAQLRIPNIPDAANNRASRFISGAARRGALYLRSSTGKHQWKYMLFFRTSFRIIFFRRATSYSAVHDSILKRDATVISVSLKFFLPPFSFFSSSLALAQAPVVFIFALLHKNPSVRSYL